MIVCTSVCSGQLAQAKVLATSLKEHIPESSLIVCLVEKELPPILENDPDFDEVVLVKDIGFENGEQVVLKYDQYEAVCACKAQLLKYAFQKHPDENNFIYLDSDVQVFSMFSEVEEAFTTFSILFTPHFSKPPEIGHLIFGENAEIQALKVGVLNGGFIGLKRNKISERFLEWLNKRLESFAFIDTRAGFHTDQKWLLAAVSLFDEVGILKHYGYNITFWNLPQRQLTKEGESYFANGEPLRFFRFSSLDWLIDHIDPANGVYPILSKYRKEMMDHSKIYPLNAEWSFDNDTTRTKKRKMKGK